MKPDPSDELASAGEVAVAYGAVTNVRALRAKEVTSITIELPEEHHVQATSLFYNRDVFVIPARLKALGYGVMSANMLDGQGRRPRPREGAAGREDEAPEGVATDAGAILARAVTIRPVPSRGISIITIELPDEYHVYTTSLLFGGDALVVASSLPEGTPHGPRQASPPPRRAAEGLGSPRTSSDHATRPRGLGKAEDQVNAARWLGIHCKEDEFQAWLGAHNEAQAIERVRKICGVASRSEIASDRAAQQRFISQLYHPFQKQQRQQRTVPASAREQLAAGSGQGERDPSVDVNGAFARFRPRGG
jgi:hypothetical protein